MSSQGASSGDMYVCFRDDAGRVVRAPTECKDHEELGSWYSDSAIDALLSEATASQQARIEELEALVKRLHGNTAATIPWFISGDSPTFDGVVKEMTAVRHRLIFCDGTDFDPDEDDCEGPDEGLVLETGFLTEADSRTVITFDAESNPDEFDAIADLLTDGTQDYIAIDSDIEGPEGRVAGRGREQPEESAFFFGSSTEGPPVSAGPGYVDLEGFEIGSISLSINYISFFYSEEDNLSTFNIGTRIFFELAE